ncbi:MAG: hypothetical protein ACRDPC_26895, partial [Solirubrobacteraceae bacterium]
GSRLERPGERAFVAWFGVRGIGTLFYVAAVTAAGSPLAAGERELIVWTAIACVVLSIVVHGVTAGPLKRWLHVNVLTQTPARHPGSPNGGRGESSERPPAPGPASARAR